VGPHIFVDVPTEARIAQEENLGPVLTVIKARDFDDALAIANGTKFASLAASSRAARPISAGHASNSKSATSTSIAGSRGPSSNGNRSAGYKMSGSHEGRGTGLPVAIPDPVNVTENTLRRGFAPPEDKEA